MRSQAQKGFTLIELMIVVAIVAILAAVAIPQYKQYTARAQISEALSLASGLETQIADYYASSGGSMPATLAATQGVATATGVQGKYVSGATVTNGTIKITFASTAASSLASLALGIAPYVDGSGNLVWICGSSDSTAPANLTLAGATGAQATAANASTTITDKTVLPKNCQ